jgi:hypothetical protein
VRRRITRDRFGDLSEERSEVPRERALLARHGRLYVLSG